MLTGRLAAATLLGWAVLIVAQAPAATARASPPPWQKTVVSIEFDDGIESQYPAGSLLAAHQMRGTFYVNSGMLGSGPAFLTWSQVAALSQAGHEIADHGVRHVRLAPLSVIEQAREACLDRSNLMDHGLRPTDFAFAYGSHTPTTETVVRNCGYNSARQVGGLDSPGCCVDAERVPPADLYSTRSVVLTSNDTVASMMGYVTAAAAHGGGWVQLVFHQLCDRCDAYAVRLSDFGRLLDWLDSVRTHGVSVATVHDVIGGSPRPRVTPPFPPVVVSSGNVLQNPSLEQAGANGIPRCWEQHEWGDVSYAFSRTSDAHIGFHAERLDITAIGDGAARLTVAQDLGECAPSVAPGHRYVLSAWYKSTAPVSFVTYYGTPAGDWNEWRSGPLLASARGWTFATFTTPPVLGGATALSFGLSMSRRGTLITDDYGLRDAEFGARPADSSAAFSAWAGGGVGALVVAATAVAVVSRRRRPSGDAPGSAP